jgi:REP element-mobilizing transposase RayT
MVQKELKQRKQIHLKDFDYCSHEYVFFLTLCTADKQPFFSDSRVANLIVEELEHRRKNHEIKLFCYCLMPDHLHLLISLNENYSKKQGAFGERTLQNWVAAFKRYTARITMQMYNIKPLWQQNFYDHVVRREESLVEICSYVLNNPVRKGMVSSWGEYPYSRMVDDLQI